MAEKETLNLSDAMNEALSERKQQIMDRIEAGQHPTEEEIKELIAVMREQRVRSMQDKVNEVLEQGRVLGEEIGKTLETLETLETFTDTIGDLPAALVGEKKPGQGVKK